MKLQHLPEYKYVEQYSRATVIAAVETTKLKEEEARVELEHTEAKEKEAIEADCAMNATFLAKVNDLMDKLMEVLATLITGDLKKIHSATGHEEFLIGGLWASAKIVNALLTLFPANELEGLKELVVNDCDLFYGKFTTDPN